MLGSRPGLLTALLMVLVLGGWRPTAADAQRLPNPVYWDAAHMQRMKDSPTPPADVVAALERLRIAADRALERAPYSVTHKTTMPPSGDRHDYQSFSRYWWPDPDQPNGLPYIRRDGRVNRALLAQGDRNALGEFMDDTVALSLAGYYFGDQRYAKQAARFVRAWFLDPETKMNPHLKYGQAVPGRSEGRGPGIIDTRGFIFVLDGVEYLDASRGWKDDDREALERWFADFAKWLQTSDIGKDEFDATNNHGVWYDAQVARYALFSKSPEITKAVVQRAKTHRIGRQFDEEGKQEAELKRTRSLHYSMFNLTALVTLARIGERVDVDLWDYRPENGCGIRCAFDYLTPYLAGREEWTYPQIEGYEFSRLGSASMRFASQRYRDEEYQKLCEGRTIRHGELDFTALVVGRYDADE